MKLVKAMFVPALILAGAVASGSVLAGVGHGRSNGSWHGHSGGGGHVHSGVFRPVHNVHFGVFVGGPVFWPGYYYAPYSYPPYYNYPLDYSPVVVEPSPEYIERGSPQGTAAQGQQSQGYWYYCAESKTYYPYVKECPGGWQRVTPQPPN